LFPEDKAAYTCNTAMKWDDPPPRQDGSGAQLARVAVFGRHGARTLAFNIPCWPGSELSYTCETESFFGFANSRSGRRSPSFNRVRGKRGVLAGDSCLAGQLTDSGVKMLVNTGMQLRATYGTALDLPYIPKEPEVMFRSTDVPRVYESAAALAWGMFPGLTDADPADVMDITVVDERSDSMKPSDTVCPGLEEALDEFYESAEAKKRAEWGARLREIIGKTTGYSPLYLTNDPKQMYNLYTFPTECWVAHACPTVPSSPKAVPPEFDEGRMKSIQREAAYWVNDRYSSSRKLQRLAYGPFIEDLLEDLREDRRRLSVYMGHDFGPANSVMDPLQLT
ncbi:hypothetical protein FOZ63_006713, partial [Perkinsus olseni]